MARVLLRPGARADLQDIARYTETSWGRRQRDVYLTAIDAKLRALAANPSLLEQVRRRPKPWRE